MFLLIPFVTHHVCEKQKNCIEKDIYVCSIKFVVFMELFLSMWCRISLGDQW